MNLTQIKERAAICANKLLICGSAFQELEGILSPMKPASRSLTKRCEPVFTGLAVVKVSLRLAWYQHVPPPS